MDTDPPIEALHHIGVAVRSLDEALPKWTDGFGLKLQSVDVVPTEQVKVAVLMAGTGVDGGQFVDWGPNIRLDAAFSFK